MASREDNWIDITTIGDRYEIQMSTHTSMKRWRLRALLNLAVSQTTSLGTTNYFTEDEEDRPWNYSEVPND